MDTTALHLPSRRRQRRRRRGPDTENNIEFLDFSDIDENEQTQLRQSLQRNNPSVELPWVKPVKKIPFKGIKHVKKNVEENDVRNISNQEYAHSSISSTPHQNQFRQPPVVLPSMVAGHFQPNTVLFASTLSPVSPPFPQNIYAIPQNTMNNGIHDYPTTTYAYTMPAQPTTYPYPTTTQQIHIPNGTTNTHVGYPATPQQVCLPGNIVTNSQVAPGVSQGYSNGMEPVTMPNKSHNAEAMQPMVNENKTLPAPPVSVDNQHTFRGDVRQPAPALPPVVQNGVKNKLENEKETVNSPSTGKSWASLFNSSKSSNGVNSQAINEVSEKVKDKTLIDEIMRNNENLCPIKHPRRSQFIDPDCYRMGEYLSTYIVDGRAVSLQPRGLINQSNNCYINSILQALIACPPLYNLLCGLAQNVSSKEKRKPTPVIDGMCRFVKEFRHLPANMRVNNRRSEGKTQKKDQGVMINTDIPFEPAWVSKMLNGIRTDLIEGRQEDAEEFLGCLLNGLNDEMLELIKLVKNDCDETPHPATNAESENDVDKEWQVMGPKNKGSVTRRTDFGRTPISDIFGGFLKSRIHRAGDHVTENIQPFFTLQLNIEKVKTVREALEALVTKYQLEGLTSSKTNEQVEAWQQVMLDELPVILVLHLKCFDFKLDGCKKIVKALDFPIDLKIDSKLLSSKTHQTPKEKQYKLFAVVYHDGKEASKGHYVTDAFHVGYSSWLRYDDASVKPVQEEHVLKPLGTRVPYLLFYRRSDTIRSK